jgi:hypothetical protein
MLKILAEYGRDTSPEKLTDISHQSSFYLAFVHIEMQNIMCSEDVTQIN